MYTACVHGIQWLLIYLSLWLSFILLRALSFPLFLSICFFFGLPFDLFSIFPRSAHTRIPISSIPIFIFGTLTPFSLSFNSLLFCCAKLNSCKWGWISIEILLFYTKTACLVAKQTISNFCYSIFTNIESTNKKPFSLLARAYIYKKKIEEMPTL